MIYGDPHDFLKYLEKNKNVRYLYAGTRYYTVKLYKDEEKRKQVIDIYMYSFLDIYMSWRYEGESIKECIDTYLKEKIHNGKSFWESQEDISWGYFEDKIREDYLD